MQLDMLIYGMDQVVAIIVIFRVQQVLNYGS